MLNEALHPASTFRQILHVDMDAFYVSVEEVEDPSLRGKAVIVGGDPDRRGVVAAASYEARKFGVHSAQPLRTARRLCPHAIFLHGDYQKYHEYSRAIYAILSEMTPLVEMVSVDEAYLDMTGCERLQGPLLAAADSLIRKIKQRTGLNCSVGASTSFLVSKIASDQAKPHGLLYVVPGSEAQFLAPLPIRRMPGIGRVMESRLRALGIERIRDLQKLSLEELKAHFGRFGEWLYLKALGKDLHERIETNGPQSLSHETTFETDTSDREELERTLSYLAQRVGRRLREPTNVDSVIYAHVRHLFHYTFNPQWKVRLLGVRASNLGTTAFQPSLLEAAQRAKISQLLEVADRVRERYGFDALQMARSLHPKRN